MAVDRVRRGEQREVNARFMALTNHYVFKPTFCNPASGWEKGRVEEGVQDARPRLWQLMPAFPDLDALNAWLEVRCIALWSETEHGSLPGAIADVRAAEQAALMPLPPRTFYDWRRYLSVIQRKSDALLATARPLLSCPRASGSFRPRCCAASEVITR